MLTIFNLLNLKIVMHDALKRKAIRLATAGVRDATVPAPYCA
jgi:hypothetical protein